MKKIVQTALIAFGMINTSLVHHFENAKVHAKKMIFPIGEPNDKFAQYFTGKSFLAPVSTSQVGIFNVTFEPGCSKLAYSSYKKQGRTDSYLHCRMWILSGRRERSNRNETWRLYTQKQKT